MHHTTSRHPGQVDIRRKSDSSILRSKVKVKCTIKRLFWHIIIHSAQVYRSNWFKTRILFKSVSQLSIQTAKNHLEVKGQGHQLDAGIIMSLKKRGTAQRLRLPAESFQNAPYDVPWPRPGGHSTKTGFKHVKVKGQGQMYEKTPILERGTAQRLRLPAESFQNAP